MARMVAELPKQNLKTRIQSRTIFVAFRTELYKCFPSHIDFLNKELLDNPLEIYEEYQFIHFMAIATKDDLAFNEGKDPFDNKECLSTASSRLTDIVNDVKSYIQARLGEEFHSGQASHIVKLMKHFSKEMDEQKEQSGFTLQTQVSHRIRCKSFEMCNQ